MTRSFSLSLSLSPSRARGRLAAEARERRRRGRGAGRRERMTGEGGRNYLSLRMGKRKRHTQAHTRTRVWLLLLRLSLRSWRLFSLSLCSFPVAAADAPAASSLNYESRAAGIPADSLHLSCRFLCRAVCVLFSLSISVRCACVHACDAVTAFLSLHWSPSLLLRFLHALLPQQRRQQQQPHQPQRRQRDHRRCVHFRSLTLPFFMLQEA